MKPSTQLLPSPRIAQSSDKFSDAGVSKANYSGNDSTKMASKKLHYPIGKCSDANAIKAWTSGLEITLWCREGHLFKR